MSATATFLEARDFLLKERDNYEGAYRGFRWPAPEGFNWALDYFDVVARGNEAVALRVVEDGSDRQVSFAEMSRRSSQVANYLHGLGVQRGDPLLVMLPNVVPLWEITLACLKLGAVLSPAATMLTPADLEDRIRRGGIRHVITDQAGGAKCGDLSPEVGRILLEGRIAGWHVYTDADGASSNFVPKQATRGDDPFLLYFTSGTTAKPKMVLHTQRSYPIGHLSTMYWIGLAPGDVHWNISSPGWAKHAWSCVFAPWNAEASVFILNQARFDAKRTLAALEQYGVTSLCAPPTVWRMLILEDLGPPPGRLREIVSAGEPLNPEVIDRVKKAWGITIRDGYGQTETTALVGNSPGQTVKSGSMGRPMPGYDLRLRDADDKEAAEGEIVIALKPRPAGLMAGYLDQPEDVERNLFRSTEHLGKGFSAEYRTCDVASRDEDGYFWYVGRADDVFKSSDYRISPFEIESALLEHEAVAEAAVVPSPDAIRLSVPKAFIVLRPGIVPSRELAASLFAFARVRLTPYQRIRRLEFGELPKTISGKIRRVELRTRELERKSTTRRPNEFWEEDCVV